MGRIIYVTEPAPAVMAGLDGMTAKGTVQCLVRLIDAVDNAFGDDFPGSVGVLRARAAEGVLTLEPPAPSIQSEACTIPAGILDELPVDALISFQWQFTVHHTSGTSVSE